LSQLTTACEILITICDNDGHTLQMTAACDLQGMTSY